MTPPTPRNPPPSPPAHPDAFAAAVRSVIAGLGSGEVVTYGEVAREAGYEGAARAVGTFLARDDPDLPWWRIVTSTGRLVPGHEREHARRLHAEGVEMTRGVPPRVRRVRRQGGGTPATQPRDRNPRSRRT